MRSFDPKLEKSLSALSPAHVANYLRDRGWRDNGPFGPSGLAFLAPSHCGDGEIILPMRQTLGDFTRRMAELVEKVADCEGRSASSIVQSMALATYDVIRIRSLDADQFGSIRFSEGVSIHDEARKLVAAAALAANSDRPKRAYKGRRPEVVDQYLDKVRLGQTENASFSITILSPFSFQPSGQGGLFEEMAFGRKVTRTFASALTGISDALARAVRNVDSAFDDSEAQGVSSEFCSSLAHLADNDLGIEVSVAWSPSKPQGAPQSIQLNRQDAEILRSISQTFAEAEPEPGYAVRGRVKGLSEPEKFNEGSFKIEADMPEFGGLRTVTIMYGPEDRNEVMTALKSNKWIEVTGDLRKAGKSLVLDRPSYFKVLDPNSN